MRVSCDRQRRGGRRCSGGWGGGLGGGKRKGRGGGVGRGAPRRGRLAAARALAAQGEPEVGGMLLAGWTRYSPATRREALEALVSRPARWGAVVEALERGEVRPAEIDWTHRDRLLQAGDAELKKRAE